MFCFSFILEFSHIFKRKVLFKYSFILFLACIAFFSQSIQALLSDWYYSPGNAILGFLSQMTGWVNHVCVCLIHWFHVDYFYRRNWSPAVLLLIIIIYGNNVILNYSCVIFLYFWLSHGPVAWSVHKLSAELSLCHNFLLSFWNLFNIPHSILW